MLGLKQDYASEGIHPNKYIWIYNYQNSNYVLT